jgi:hypothetical protein
MRKGCTIGLELGDDMTVADIVRNVPRTGFTNLTHQADHGEAAIRTGMAWPS